MQRESERDCEERKRKKENGQPKGGGILRRGVRCASRRPPLGVRLFLSHFAVPRSPILAATFMPPRGRPTLVVLPPVASSSVASLSSASSCDAAAACRSLALAASPAFRRNSALLAAYFGPSSLSSSPRARTTLLTPTPIICRQVISLLRSTLSSTDRVELIGAGSLGYGTGPSFG